MGPDGSRLPVVDRPPRRIFGLLGPNGQAKPPRSRFSKGSHAGPRRRRSPRPAVGSRRRRAAAAARYPAAGDAVAEKLSVEETLGCVRSFYRRGRSIDDSSESWSSSRSDGAGSGSCPEDSVAARHRMRLAGAPDSFLDEPTTGLDPQSRRQLWGVLERFRAEGGTVVRRPITWMKQRCSASCGRRRSRTCDRPRIAERPHRPVRIPEVVTHNGTPKMFSCR